MKLEEEVGKLSSSIDILSEKIEKLPSSDGYVVISEQFEKLNSVVSNGLGSISAFGTIFGGIKNWYSGRNNSNEINTCKCECCKNCGKRGSNSDSQNTRRNIQNETRDLSTSSPNTAVVQMEVINQASTTTVDTLLDNLAQPSQESLKPPSQEGLQPSTVESNEVETRTRATSEESSVRGRDIGKAHRRQQEKQEKRKLERRKNINDNRYNRRGNSSSASDLNSAVEGIIEQNSMNISEVQNNDSGSVQDNDSGSVQENSDNTPKKGGKGKKIAKTMGTTAILTVLMASPVFASTGEMPDTSVITGVGQGLMSLEGLASTVGVVTASMLGMSELPIMDLLQFLPIDIGSIVNGKLTGILGSIGGKFMGLFTSIGGSLGGIFSKIGAVLLPPIMSVGGALLSMAWPVLLVIGALYALTALFNWATGESVSATGILFGALAVVGAILYNVVAYIVNSVKLVCYTLDNFKTMIKIATNSFMLNLLESIKPLAGLIDKVIGTNLAGNIDNFIDKKN